MCLQDCIQRQEMYYVIVTYLMDLAMSNAWRLFQIGVQKDTDQLQFKRSVVRNYLREAKVTRSSKKRKPSSDIAAMQQVFHLPTKLPCQLRCHMCHKKARYQCGACLKTFCLETARNCFKSFHTNTV